MRVHDVVNKSELQHAANHILVVAQWVITNEGTSEKPWMTARLVAQEFAEKSAKGNLYMGTPILTALRYLLSLCVIRDSSCCSTLRAHSCRATPRGMHSSDCHRRMQEEGHEPTKALCFGAAAGRSRT